MKSLSALTSSRHVWELENFAVAPSGKENERLSAERAASLYLVEKLTSMVEVSETTSGLMLRLCGATGTIISTLQPGMLSKYNLRKTCFSRFSVLKYEYVISLSRKRSRRHGENHQNRGCGSVI